MLPIVVLEFYSLLNICVDLEPIAFSTTRGSEMSFQRVFFKCLNENVIWLGQMNWRCF